MIPLYPMPSLFGPRAPRVPLRLPLARASLLAILVAAIHAPDCQGGSVYWNMESLAPTANSVVGLSASSVSQGNTSVTGTSGQSVSSGYSLSLDDTSIGASGGSNLHFRAVAGSLATGSSSYLEFTLTNSGIDALTVTHVGFGSRSTSTGPLAYALRSNRDAYASDIAGGTGTLLNDSVWAYRDAVLTTPLAIAPSGAATLRLYAAGGSLAANDNWRIDDLRVVVVPEPASLTLAVAATAGLVGITARRRPRAGLSPSART